MQLFSDKKIITLGKCSLKSFIYSDRNKKAEKPRGEERQQCVLRNADLGEKLLGVVLIAVLGLS